MFFILFGFIFVIGSIIAYRKWSDDTFVGWLTITIIYFFLCLAIGGASYSDTNSRIDEFLEFRDKIEHYQKIYPYRKHLSDEEILQVFEYNRWIEKGKINDKSFAFGFFTPNRFRELKSIESEKLFF